MNTFGLVSYGATALGFALLTVLLATGWQGRHIGARLIAASGVTTLWATLLALHSLIGRMPAILVYSFEILRDAGWLYVLTGLAAATAPRWLRLGVHLLWICLLLAGFAGPLLLQNAPSLASLESWLTRAGLLLSLAGLVLLEQIYRNATPAARSVLRYFAIGVGSLLVYDLLLYSQAEMLQLSADVWNARGIVNLFAVPLIALAVRRDPKWSLDIFVSRQVVFYTTTCMAAGTYLVIIALGGYLVREYGGRWGTIGQILFFSGAAVAFATLIASRTLQRRLQVFISKHFYRNKYDYRIEWLRFIATLSSTDEEDVRRTAIRALTQIFASPGGILFTLDEEGRQFEPVVAWPIRVGDVPAIRPVGAASELAAFLDRKQWIVDLREYQETPDTYQNIELPPWLTDNPNLRIVAPLLQLERLTGFFVLYDPPPPFELTYEDRDLMKTVGRHVATHIAQHDADRRLAESRQFEAYNRLTAFMMHDLKNSVAQLKLLVTNAARHKHNPQFIDDAIETIANTVERMTRLIEQLRSTTPNSRLQEVAFDELVRAAVARCSLRSPVPMLEAQGSRMFVRADPDRLTGIVEHVIRNAQDAAIEGGQVAVQLTAEAREARLTVADTGSGMAPEFVRERLFRPFDSTKGSKGMGIGAYQTREYVRTLGGHVEVQSSPGQGTTFSITLPASSESSRMERAERAAHGE